jgi:hypothetical protein
LGLGMEELLGGNMSKINDGGAGEVVGEGRTVKVGVEVGAPSNEEGSEEGEGTEAREEAREEVGEGGCMEEEE